MRRFHLSFLAALSWLVACSSGAPSTHTSSRADQLSTNGVTATLQIQSDWKAGYCADVTLQNTSSTPVTSWTVVIDLQQSASTNLWNGSATQSGSQITVKPVAAWNSSIAPGASLGAFGFCASATGSSYLPVLVSIAVVGGIERRRDRGLRPVGESRERELGPGSQQHQHDHHPPHGIHR